MATHLYRSKLSLIDTEKAIKLLKDTFERELANNLNLTRVSAPLYVQPETGLNDNLSGVERPVSFDVPSLNGATCEIVHSLAKWKRQALYRYGFANGEGLYTDMDAIRRDEQLDGVHSLYVDQWDWERIIEKKDRNIDTLIWVAEQICDALHKTEDKLIKSYPVFGKKLPDKLHVISSRELFDTYPDKTDKEREDIICQQFGMVLLTQIGVPLSNGLPHDSRAPDYDDWELNGDLLVWDSVLNRALELSSMGIRVDAESMNKQLKMAHKEERAKLPYHQGVLNNILPLTVGGGIGQSRLCLYFLEKQHIGEVQASVWPESMVKECEEKGIQLL